jgi:LysR family nitrogen assimilation transcriptional regulator
MHIAMLSTRLLLYFVRIAELGSLTRASAGLQMSQSVLSRHVAALEAALGYRVFYRTGRGISLTEEGRSLLPRARDLLARSVQFMDEAKALGGEPSGVVVLGMPGSIASILAGPVYKLAQGRYPKVRLRLVEGLSGVIDEMLTLGRLDIGLRYADGPKRRAGEKPLCTLDLYLVAPPGDTLTARGTVRLRDLEDRPFFLPSAPHAVRRLMEDLFAKNRLSLNVPLEVDSLSTMVQVVAAGGGYTVAPYSAVAHLEAAGRVRLARITHPTIRRTLVMALSPKGPMTGAIQAVTVLISELAAELVKEGQVGGVVKVPATVRP